MEQNQQVEAPKSYLMSQANLDNLVKYLNSQPYAVADPIMRFLQGALAPVDEKAATELVQASQPKKEEAPTEQSPRRRAPQGASVK